MLSIVFGCDGSANGRVESGREPVVLAASAVHVLGTPDAIARVDDVEVLPDGTVWVQNSVEPFFIAFAADGGVVEAHGRQGGGPREFEAPAGFVAGGIEGGAWVFDRRRHALIEVSRADAARREIALPRDAVAPGSVTGGIDLLGGRVRTARLGERVVLPRMATDRETDVLGYWRSVFTADLVALSMAGDTVETVVPLGAALGDPSAHFELPAGSPPFLPFPLWYRLWAVCGDEVRVYDRFRNVVRGFAADGRERDPIALPPPRYAEVTPREFARATVAVRVVEVAGGATDTDVSAADSARIIAEILPRLDATPAQLANLLPRYVDFRCDDEGAVWLRPFDLEAGGLSGGTLWLRVARDDGDVRAFHLPERFDAYRFTRGRIYGVQRDALDVASIAWIDIPGER